MLYGLRYDLFNVPAARQFGPNPYSKNFAIDKNNFGPRAGVSWSVDSSAHTVVRASMGLMYEPPLLDFYDNAILNNGDPKSYNVGPVLPTAAGAPAFPGNLPTPPPGFVLPKQSINAVDQNFETQSAWLSNVQLERALNSDRRRHRRVRQLDRTESAGADGRQPGRVGQTLADGRPIFSRRARRPDVRPHQCVPVDRRIDLQRVHRDADQADDPRVA